jgi:hypothetical protein
MPGRSADPTALSDPAAKASLLQCQETSPQGTFHCNRGACFATRKPTLQHRSLHRNAGVCIATGKAASQQVRWRCNAGLCATAAELAPAPGSWQRPAERYIATEKATSQQSRPLCNRGVCIATGDVTGRCGSLRGRNAAQAGYRSFFLFRESDEGGKDWWSNSAGVGTPSCPGCGRSRRGDKEPRHRG